jgi:hypothetical protein
MISLQKKSKYSVHRKVNLIAPTAKRVLRILRRRIERKSGAVHGENRFGFRRGKGTGDAIGMLRKTSANCGH